MFSHVRKLFPKRQRKNNKNTNPPIKNGVKVNNPEIESKKFMTGF